MDPGLATSDRAYLQLAHAQHNGPYDSACAGAQTECFAPDYRRGWGPVNLVTGFEEIRPFLRRLVPGRTVIKASFFARLEYRMKQEGP